MKKILFVFGTRPEAIKLAPVIMKARSNSDFFESVVCVTGQHREMLYQVLDFFRIGVDYNLKLMEQNQDITKLTAKILVEFGQILVKERPDLVVVQGDTTTAFSGALVSFYEHVKVAHVEAGLRTNNKLAPWPEEINRVLVGHIAEYHFAPTQRAVTNLCSEGITKNVWNVGNTVIDALLLGLSYIKKYGVQDYERYFSFVDFSKKILLVTGHRRESFGKPFDNICTALERISRMYRGEIEIVYPVHLNPKVKNVVYKKLSGYKNIKLIEPLSYSYMIYIMNKAYAILTDSGGIQEEAPTLGKPVLVMRDTTERPEGVEAGTSKLVGTDIESIVRGVKTILEDPSEYEKMANAVNPYGDGKTSERIINILRKELSRGDSN